MDPDTEAPPLVLNKNELIQQFNIRLNYTTLCPSFRMA